MIETNTALARRLADLYQRLSGKEFPGGVTNAKIVRTYAGRHQRAAGTWSWVLMPISGLSADMTIVGSQWPASECARAKVVSLYCQYGDREFIPEST